MLFICDFPSGGTDLTKNVLNAHPDVQINGEIPFLPKLLKLGYGPGSTYDRTDNLVVLKNQLRDLDPWSNITNIEYDFEEDLDKYSRLNLDYVLMKCFSDKSRLIWGSKTPQYTENLETLHKLFPEAKFLVVVRDVWDVCLSWHRKWGKDLFLCSNKWASRMAQGWMNSQEIPEKQVKFIKFEDILANTGRTSYEICQFLGIDFSKNMLESHRFIKEIIDGKINYGSRIMPENMNKWRDQLKPEDVNRIEEIAFDSMILFQYEASYATKSKPYTKLESATGNLKDVWSIITVSNRARSNNDLGRRLSDLEFELKKWFRN